MTLIEQIENANKFYNETMGFFNNSPFIEREEDHWSEYIINCIKKDGDHYDSCTGSPITLTADLFDDDREVLYSVDHNGQHINSRRTKALVEWCGKNGLFVYFKFNLKIEIITPRMLAEMSEKYGLHVEVGKVDIVS